MAIPHTDSPLPAAAPFALFPGTSPVLETNDTALIEDFLEWMETVWCLPIHSPEVFKSSIPLPVMFTAAAYTCRQLSDMLHLSPRLMRLRLYKYRIPACYHDLTYTRGGASPECYRQSDMAPYLPHWNDEHRDAVLTQRWRRFCHPACGRCHHCRKLKTPETQQLFCTRNVSILLLRRTFAEWFVSLGQHGSISAWWHTCQSLYVSSPCKQRHHLGIIFIYLLDRQYLHLDDDTLIHLAPLRAMDVDDLVRPWRNRHPEEYDQVQQGLALTTYRASSQRYALAMFATLGVLKYGITTLTQLSRPLLDHEIRQVIAEERLVTTHLSSGVYLPLPMNPDVRVGHVLLDDMRRFFWRYAAQHRALARHEDWHRGPGQWRHMHVSEMEQALCAPRAAQEKGFLSRRPEVEGHVRNPLWTRHEGEVQDDGFHLLPKAIQQQFMSYVQYRYQEKHREISTLQTQTAIQITFLQWVRRRGEFTTYPLWTRSHTHEIFRAYVTECLMHLTATSRRAILNALAVFFQTLAELEMPCPPGYQILPTLERGGAAREKKEVPREAIMDRIFRDGVCRLEYDPFSRLALTIQYFCGTRISETLDLRLFCIIEDEGGHLAMLIPKGKTKQERPFPLVEMGMGPLLQFMDDIMRLRVRPDRSSRVLGKTNYRYLVDAPEEAQDWQYLFDRVPERSGRTVRGRLSRARVEMAMQEVLRIAAKIDPTGLFDERTYDAHCHFRRRLGMRCNYVVVQEGVTCCPRCAATLPGTIGFHCRRILRHDVYCSSVGEPGTWFCPSCDAPLAKFRPISTHSFRHNSVGRAHRAGVSLAHNMQIHGHQTVAMHLRYLHLFLEDCTDEVKRIFAEKRLREVRQMLHSTSGQMVVAGVAVTPTLEQYLHLTLQRALTRRTYGIWGGFWAGSLAQQGIASPHPMREEIIILEETYEHAVAQYWYETLGLAVSEVAFERFTHGKWQAIVPRFLDRRKIEELVQVHLHVLRDSLGTSFGPQLMETDIREQRQAVQDLGERLRPWWQDLGSIEALVTAFMAGGNHAFQQQLSPPESTA